MQSEIRSQQIGIKSSPSTFFSLFFCYLSIAEIVVHFISLLFYTCTVVYLCFLTMNMLFMFGCDKLGQAFEDSSFCILVKFLLSFIFLCSKFFNDVFNDVVVEERKVVITMKKCE